MAGFGLVVLCGLAALAGQPAAGGNDVYVVPFSHLDLFWAGSREECLLHPAKVKLLCDLGVRC
jgi:hypothetical protein